MLYLLRHGDAEDSRGDDAARALSAKGKRQGKAAGLALAAMEARIGACLTSPKLRAEQTARLACLALGIEPEASEDLSGGHFDGPALAAGRDDTLLVGHEPDLSGEVGRLTGARVKLRKGGLAVIDGSTLMALLGPKDLAAIAAAKE